MNMPQHTFKTDQETIDLRALSRGLYIDGQWRQAADGRLIEVVDPSTEARDRDGSRCGHGRRRGSGRGRRPGRGRLERRRRRASDPKSCGAASN